MKKILLYSLLLIGVLAGCKKSVDQPPASTPTPAAKTGSIIGTISPASTAISVSATDQSTTYTATSEANTGAFELPDMLPGTYKINFSRLPSGYFRPDTTVKVEAGQVINLGPVTRRNGGVFTGRVSPIGSVYAMWVLDSLNNAVTSATPNATTGEFTTAEIFPGTYRVRLAVLMRGYKAPISVTATLAPGQSLDLGTLTALPNMISGLPFTQGISGTTQTYAAPLLNIYTNDMGLGVGPSNIFTLKMDNINGTGTYQCLGTATSAMTYENKSSSGGGLTWSTSNAGGRGMVVVTSIDPIKKEIRGTFIATLVSNTAGVANVVINNGSFYFAY